MWLVFFSYALQSALEWLSTLSWFNPGGSGIERREEKLEPIGVALFLSLWAEQLILVIPVFFLRDWFFVILSPVVPPQALHIPKSLFLQHLELSIWKNSGIAGWFHSCLRPVTILTVVSDVVWRSKPPVTLWCSVENTLSNQCCQKELFCESALSGCFCLSYMLVQSCNKPDQESPGPYCSLTSVHKSFW